MKEIWLFWLSIHPGTEPSTRSSLRVCQHLQPSHQFTAQPRYDSQAVTQTRRLLSSDPSSSPTAAKDEHSYALSARRQRAAWAGRRWQKLSNHSLFFVVRVLFHPRTPSPWVTGTGRAFSSFSSDISSASACRRAEMRVLCVPLHLAPRTPWGRVRPCFPALGWSQHHGPFCYWHPLGLHHSLLPAGSFSSNKSKQTQPRHEANCVALLFLQSCQSLLISQHISRPILPCPTLLPALGWWGTCKNIPKIILLKIWGPEMWWYCKG